MEEKKFAVKATDDKATAEVKATAAGAADEKETSKPVVEEPAMSTPEKKPAKRAAAKAGAPEAKAAKAPAPKAEKKPAAKKPSSSKKAQPAAQEPQKKPAAKRAVAKKVSQPAAQVVIQYQEKEVAAKDILEKAKSAFAESNPGVEIKTIDIYVKPEENAAYFVVNGMAPEDNKIDL